MQAGSVGPDSPGNLAPLPEVNPPGLHRDPLRRLEAPAFDVSGGGHNDRLAGLESAGSVAGVEMTEEDRERDEQNEKRHHHVSDVAPESREEPGLRPEHHAEIVAKDPNREEMRLDLSLRRPDRLRPRGPPGNRSKARRR